jgi:hypothetical protein
MTWLVVLLERLMARQSGRWTPPPLSAGGGDSTLSLPPSGAVQRRHTTFNRWDRR